LRFDDEVKRGRHGQKRNFSLVQRERIEIEKGKT